MYFGPEEETIIRQYIETRDESLYRASVRPLLRNIAYGVRRGKKYRPRAYFEAPGVIHACEALMWEKLLTNFDPDRGHKAYSYLTRIAQNFFFHVAKVRRKEKSTLYYAGLQIGRLWDESHDSIQDRETSLIEAERTSVRNGTMREFVKDYLHATPAQEEKIFDEIEALPRAHKKGVNGIIYDVLEMDKFVIRKKGPVRVKRGKRENIHESMMKNLARCKRSFRKHKIIPLKRSGEL